MLLVNRVKSYQNKIAAHCLTARYLLGQHRIPTRCLFGKNHQFKPTCSSYPRDRVMQFIYTNNNKIRLRSKFP